MEDFRPIIIVALVGASLGMGSIPKIPTASINFTQKLTTYVNALIGNCVDSCEKTNIESNCDKSCTDFTVFTTGEYHDTIINKMGNVL